MYSDRRVGVQKRSGSRKTFSSETCRNRPSLNPLHTLKECRPIINRTKLRDPEEEGARVHIGTNARRWKCSPEFSPTDEKSVGVLRYITSLENNRAQVKPTQLGGTASVPWVMVIGLE